MVDWKHESEMFNNAADYYDKYRPGYPDGIIETFIKETGIKKGSNIVEIGAGSGKATEHIAGKGFNILCIEPGYDLARIGNERFDGDSIKFEVSRFENYDLPENYNDVVFAAQSFHWVPQPVGYEKCAFTLKKEGHLAILYNMYILFENEQDKKLLHLSNKYGGIADFLNEKECDERIKSIIGGIENSGLFKNVRVHKELWKQNYTADEYFGFALTGNRFMQKSEDEKKKAYEEIKILADENGGIIERPYLCVLYLAEKLG